MQNFRTLLIFCIAGVTAIQGHGNFKSYNNVERKDFVLQKYQSRNEVDSELDDDGQFDTSVRDQKYSPNWASLDTRPLPEWYDQDKIGIFIHWGVFSVPGVGSEWFWKQWKEGRKDCVEFMEQNFKPNFTYQEFAPQFTAEFYDPNAWANLFAKSGAKYVVLTSKHHEGFTLWPSRYSFSWNAKDVGPHRDVLGELAESVRANTSLKFGLYHSLYEWFNPMWMRDRDNNQTTHEFVEYKILPEMYELVNKYKPEVLWSDGEWEAEDKYWRSEEFIAWLYNDSPVKDTVVTNDRWGHDTSCKHGGFYTCSDRYNPGVLQPHKWENCFTLDKQSWGYRRNAKIEDYLTPEELITTIIESVSCGGNVLLNVGPTREGTIVPIQQERLLQMGEWLNVNGEAIYNSVPWTHQNDTVTKGVWYTTSADKTKIYAMMTSWPGKSIQLGAVNELPGMNITMLGMKGSLEWEAAAAGGIVVIMPRSDDVSSKWGWTLVIS